MDDKIKNNNVTSLEVLPVVRSVGVDASSEECTTRVACMGSVVVVIIGRVATDLK